MHNRKSGNIGSTFFGFFILGFGLTIIYYIMLNNEPYQPYSPAAYLSLQERQELESLFK